MMMRILNHLQEEHASIERTGWAWSWLEVACQLKVRRLKTKSLYNVSESWKGVKLVGGSASSVGYWAGAGWQTFHCIGQPARPWHKCHRSPLALQLTSLEQCLWLLQILWQSHGGQHWDSKENLKFCQLIFFDHFLPENISFGAKSSEQAGT